MSASNRNDRLDPGALYREISTERSPKSLDDAVLAAATATRKARRSRYLAPIALAATVVLAVSVAIRAPVPHDAVTATPAAESAQPASRDDSDVAVEESANAMIERDDYRHVEDAELGSRARQSIDTARAASVPAQDSASSETSADSAEFERRRLDALREKAERAPGARQGKSRVEVAVANDSAPQRAEAELAAQGYVEDPQGEACANERTTAERWLDCLLRLRSEDDPGYPDEREAFIEAHPDAAIPEPD